MEYYLGPFIIILSFISIYKLLFIMTRNCSLTISQDTCFDSQTYQENSTYSSSSDLSENLYDSSSNITAEITPEIIPPRYNELFN